MAAWRKQTDLTQAQARLLERHQRGIVRLAMVLSEKRGSEPIEVMVLLAHRNSNVGGVAREHLAVPGTTDVIVIPGILHDLHMWLERLAVSGPVYDCAVGEDGIVVIVIDENGEMALCKIEWENRH